MKWIRFISLMLMLSIPGSVVAAVHPQAVHKTVKHKHKSHKHPHAQKFQYERWDDVQAP